MLIMLNSYRQHLINNDVPVAIFLSLAFYKYSAGSNMHCHASCVEFKTNKYIKYDEIRLVLGVT